MHPEAVPSHRVSKSPSSPSHERLVFPGDGGGPSPTPGYLFLRDRAALELHAEVVLDAELNLEVVRAEAVAEVVAARPLELPTEHDVLRRRGQQVERGVLTVPEGVRRLARAVGDVDARIADRRAQHLVPGMIEVQHQPEHGK